MSPLVNPCHHLALGVAGWRTGDCSGALVLSRRDRTQITLLIWAIMLLMNGIVWTPILLV